MEKSYKENYNKHLQHAGNEYYEYLNKMKGEHAEDTAEYSTMFMTF